MTTNPQAALDAAVRVYIASLGRDEAAAHAASINRSGYYSPSSYTGKGVNELAAAWLEWLNTQDATLAEEEKVKAKGTLEERVTRLEEK